MRKQPEEPAATPRRSPPPLPTGPEPAHTIMDGIMDHHPSPHRATHTHKHTPTHNHTYVHVHRMSFIRLALQSEASHPEKKHTPICWTDLWQVFSPKCRPSAVHGGSSSRIAVRIIIIADLCLAAAAPSPTPPPGPPHICKYGKHHVEQLELGRPRGLESQVPLH